MNFSSFYKYGEILNVYASNGSVCIRIGWTGRGRRPAYFTGSPQVAFAAAAALVEALPTESFSTTLERGLTITRRGADVALSMGPDRPYRLTRTARLSHDKVSDLVKALIDAALAAAQQNQSRAA